jgi:hypothetical protein
MHLTTSFDPDGSDEVQVRAVHLRTHRKAPRSVDLSVDDVPDVKAGADPTKKVLRRLHQAKKSSRKIGSVLLRLRGSP